MGPPQVVHLPESTPCSSSSGGSSSSRGVAVGLSVQVVEGGLQAAHAGSSRRGGRHPTRRRPRCPGCWEVAEHGLLLLQLGGGQAPAATAGEAEGGRRCRCGGSGLAQGCLGPAERGLLADARGPGRTLWGGGGEREGEDAVGREGSRGKEAEGKPQAQRAIAGMEGNRRHNVRFSDAKGRATNAGHQRGFNPFACREGGCLTCVAVIWLGCSCEGPVPAAAPSAAIASSRPFGWNRMASWGHPRYALRGVGRCVGREGGSGGVGGGEGRGGGE